MTTIRWTMLAGVVVLAGLIWLATIGFTAVVPPLVTVGALLLLVGGGNWLSGRRSPHGAPDHRPPPPGPGAPLPPPSPPTAGSGPP